MVTASERDENFPSCFWWGAKLGNAISLLGTRISSCSFSGRGIELVSGHSPLELSRQYGSGRCIFDHAQASANRVPGASLWKHVLHCLVQVPVCALRCCEARFIVEAHEAQCCCKLFQPHLLLLFLYLCWTTLKELC